MYDKSRGKTYAMIMCEKKHNSTLSYTYFSKFKGSIVPLNLEKYQFINHNKIYDPFNQKQNVFLYA